MRRTAAAHFASGISIDAITASCAIVKAFKFVVPLLRFWLRD